MHAIAGLFMTFALAVQVGASSPAPARSGQDEGAREGVIVVEARALGGRFGVAQMRGDRMWLPVVAIARALGDTVRVDVQARAIEVRRASGASADFIAPLGQVRENGVPVFELTDVSEVIFGNDDDALLLPTEVVAALLDVSIVRDVTSRAVRIRRGVANDVTTRPGAQHGAVELYRADFSYTLDAGPFAFTQGTNVTAGGRAGDGRFRTAVNLSGGNGEVLAYRSGFFDYERASGRRFVLGDFSAGSDVAFLTGTVRGALIAQRIAGATVTAYAGRAVSDSRLVASPVEPRPEPSYDATAAGVYVTFAPEGTAGSGGSLRSSIGASYFRAPGSSGQLIAGSLRYLSERHLFETDLGFGRFRGRQSSERSVDGTAALIHVSDVWDASHNLTLRGNATYVGQNYLAVESAGLIRPMRGAGLGASWREGGWFGASVFAEAQSLLDGSDERRNSVSTTVSVNGSGSAPDLFVSQTRTASSTQGDASNTLVTVAKDLGRWRLFGNLTRTRVRESAASWAGVGGVFLPVGPSSTLLLRHSYASGGAVGGSADWTSTGLFNGRLSFGSGIEYLREPARTVISPRARITSALGRGNVLQVTFASTPEGPQWSIGFGGSFSRPNADARLSGAAGAIATFGSVYGRVYQDTDLNGRYDPVVDQPMRNVRIFLDGANSVLTDGDGLYRAPGIPVGEHVVALDLLTVRADLTLLGNFQSATHLEPSMDTIVDFRLVRTGRISGRLWLDADGNGRFDSGDEPLSDVRLVTGSGRDTLTNSDGEFHFGDLPPGEHVVAIDAKTLSPGVRPVAGPRTVVVRGALETGNVDFPVVVIPRDVEIKEFPPSSP